METSDARIAISEACELPDLWIPSCRKKIALQICAWEKMALDRNRPRSEAHYAASRPINHRDRNNFLPHFQSCIPCSMSNHSALDLAHLLGKLWCRKRRHEYNIRLQVPNYSRGAFGVRLAQI